MYLSGPQILHSGINAPDMLVSEGRFLLYSRMYYPSDGIKVQSDNSGVSAGLRGCQSGLEAGRSVI